MTTATCAKCGSPDEIPDVRIIDHGDGNAALDLAATIYRDPGAVLFKGAVSHKFRARVCGACGFTEFYVENPGSLLAAARQAKPRKPKKKARS